MPHIIRPSIIDVEASGFGPSSYPIEIGVVLMTGERFCSLILPDRDWTYWDTSAEKVHRVTREVLRSHGRPIREVARELNDLLRGQTIYSDGWVVDKPWVEQLFYAARLHMRFYISALETILTESQMNVWHDTKARVADDLNLRRHRASADAFIIQETYARTIEG